MDLELQQLFKTMQDFYEKTGSYVTIFSANQSCSITFSNSDSDKYK
jgi:hypothetical protein